MAPSTKLYRTGALESMSEGNTGMSACGPHLPKADVSACPQLAKADARSPNPKGPPSSLVQLRTAVWTGDARDTRPIPELKLMDFAGGSECPDQIKQSRRSDSERSSP